jgi:hypothetical protein
VPDAAAGKTQVGHRDRKAETQVAELFKKIRRDAKMPKLKRIDHRAELQQLACTVTVLGKSPEYYKSGCPVLGVDEKCQYPYMTSALYATSNPAEQTPELERIARLETRGSLPRYAVAVWSVPSEAVRRPRYWVAIKLYPSAGMEFFETHFTDAMEWKNEWKKFVAPQCRQSK